MAEYILGFKKDDIEEARYATPYVRLIKEFIESEDDCISFESDDDKELNQTASQIRSAQKKHFEDAEIKVVKKADKVYIMKG